MAFQHILVATGGAEHSLRAEEGAAELATALGAKVTILSVVKVTSQMHTFGEAFEMSLEQHKAVLKAAEWHCETRGLTPQTVLKAGSVGQAIVETADELGCDLIVVGRRKLSLASAAVVGSVSDHVIRHASCAVLVAT